MNGLIVFLYYLNILADLRVQADQRVELFMAGRPAKKKMEISVGFC